MVQYYNLNGWSLTPFLALPIQISASSATINELKRDLKGRQIKLILAGRKTELTRWFKESRPTMKDDDMILAPDLYLALRFIQSKESMSEGESGVVE